MKYLNLNSLPDDLKELCLKSKDDPDAKYEKVNLAPVDKFIRENQLDLEILGLLFYDGRRSGLMKCTSCASTLQKENGHPFSMAGVN